MEEKNAGITSVIRQKALELGFTAVGFTKVRLPDEYIRKYEEWLNRNYHGSMDYLVRHLPLKKNPEQVLENALSVICVSLLYRTEDCLTDDPHHGYFSIYARGRDYHKVVKKKLTQLIGEIHKIAGDCHERAFVDSGPVFEKYYAAEAGIGAIGRNSLVISSGYGSFFFLGELITSLPIDTDSVQNFDPCRGCARCLEHCPVNAILDNRQINAGRCIAYLTIEHKGIIPYKLTVLMGNRVYGCDSCQKCCPWNRKIKITAEPDFSCRLTDDIVRLDNLIKFKPEDFSETFAGTPVHRIGYESFIRNVVIAAGNSGDLKFIPVLQQMLAANPGEVISQHLIWSINNLTAGNCR